MKYKLFLVSFFLFIVPTISHAQAPQLLFSEVAWMGTDENSSHEWIELYNISGAPLDLNGWTITSDSGLVSINLSGTLTVHGVGLVERDTDNAVPGVTAMLTYQGELLDSGDSLSLINPAGNTVDRADGGTNWLGIGGSNVVPKKTPQRTRMGTWVTASPTPGPEVENAQVSDPLPDPDETNDATATTTEQDNVSASNSSSGGSSKRRVFAVSIIASTTAYVEKPTSFLAEPSGVTMTKIKSVEYNWNFGDTGVSEETEPTHSFMFPGEYVVMLEASSSNKQVVVRHDIEILPQPVSLSLTNTGDIAIKNIGETELVLDGYELLADNFELIFPKNSFLKPDATITLSRSKVGKTNKLEMNDLDNFVIATLYIGDSTITETSATNNLSTITTPLPLAGTYSTTNVNKATTDTKSPVFKVATAGTEDYRFGFATQNNTATAPKVVNKDESKLTTEDSATPDKQINTSSKHPFRNMLNRIAHFLGIG